MTPEADRFLQQAEAHLQRGRVMLDTGLYEDAGRAAYLTAFHAAQALLFERTGRVVKTHRGVQSEFLRLAKDDPSFTPEQRVFLSRAYNFKATADYDAGSQDVLTAEEASAALLTAHRFLQTVRRALTPDTAVS